MGAKQNIFSFLRGLWRAPHRTGAIAPSSRHLARTMCEPLKTLPSPSLVVEAGAGTGVVTEILLQVLPADSQLLVFEINPEWVNLLRTRFTDKRVRIIPESIFTLPEHIDRPVNALVSSLPLALFSRDKRERFFEMTKKVLEPDGLYIQFLYAPHLIRPIRHHFRIERTRLVFRNLPPALVLICRKI